MESRRYHYAPVHRHSHRCMDALATILEVVGNFRAAEGRRSNCVKKKIMWKSIWTQHTKDDTLAKNGQHRAKL